LHTHFVQTFLYLFFFFFLLLQRLGFDFGIDVMLLVFFLEIVALQELEATGYWAG